MLSMVRLAEFHALSRPTVHKRPLWRAVVEKRSLGLLFAILLAATPAPAQEQRWLPPQSLSFGHAEELPVAEPFSGQVLSYSQPSGDSVKPLLDQPLDVPPAEEVDPDRPRDARSGFFQKLFFNAAWLSSGGQDGWDMTDLELKATVAVPIPSRRWPMLISPGFATHFLNGPAAPELPAKVYDSYVQFRWWRRLTPRFGVDLAVTPGLYGDYEQTSDGALRITGYAAGVFNWTETAKLVAGASYLDRQDVPVLPIGGIVWNPNDEYKFEIVCPRPKIAKRVYWAGATGPDVQDWIYIAGDLGGGIWAFQRGPTTDVFSYRDYRAILGVERWDLVGLDFRVEVAYVFGRKIEYRSDAPNVFPSDAVMLSGGVTY